MATIIQYIITVQKDILQTKELKQNLPTEEQAHTDKTVFKVPIILNKVRQEKTAPPSSKCRNISFISKVISFDKLQVIFSVLFGKWCW